MLRCAAKCTSLLAQYTPGQWVDVGEISMRTRYFIFKFIHLSWRFCRSWFFGLRYGQTQLALHCIDWFVRGLKTAKGATNFMRKVWIFVSMESASADDVRARGSPKGLVLAPLQAQAQHYPKGEGWKRSQFGSRKRSQTDRQTDAPTTTTLIASGPPLRGDPYFVCISTTLLRNKKYNQVRYSQLRVPCLVKSHMLWFVNTGMSSAVNAHRYWVYYTILVQCAHSMYPYYQSGLVVHYTCTLTDSWCDIRVYVCDWCDTRYV